MSFAEKDCARSGLGRPVLQKLKIVDLTPDETHEATENSFGCYSYKIPYFDINGKEFQDYSRLRLDLGADIDIKYYQKSNTIPKIYIPPLTDWVSIASDVSQVIVITEGEKKAAKATLVGVPTIGLGGVWSFKAKKASLPLIDDFHAIDWKGRRVEIVFDSDARTKAGVYAAMHALSVQLLKLGAYPTYVQLEQDGADKVGLDDYLLSHSKQNFLELPRNGFGLVEQLYAMNANYAYIRNLGRVLLRDTGVTVALSSFAFESSIYKTVQIDANGNQKEVATAPSWISWEGRAAYNELAYVPGGEEVLPDNSLNTWTGWPTIAIKGSAKPFKDLLSFLFTNPRKEKEQAARDIEWLIQWFAYPIQHPGTKLMTAVMVFGNKHGKGKTLLGEIMCGVYGPRNSVILTHETLFGDAFNSDWVQKQFVVCDDIAPGAGTKKETSFLKTLVTSKTVRVREKFQSGRIAQDYRNFYLTSNYEDALTLDGDDRRFFCIQATTETKETKFFTDIAKWSRTPAGIAALRHYFENEVDTANFDPNARAPETEDKRLMQTASYSDLQILLHEWMTVETMAVGGLKVSQELFSIQDLQRLIALAFPRLDMSARAISRYLRDVGITQIGPICGSKVFILRNREYWHGLRGKKLIEKATDHYQIIKGGGIESEKIVSFNRGG